MKYIAFLLAGLLMSLTLHAQYEASGGTGTPYKYTDNLTGTGLDAVYVFNTLSGAEITYNSDNPNVQIYRYHHSEADKVLLTPPDISTSVSGGVTTYRVVNLMDGYGYIIEEGGAKPTYGIWVIDYAQHQPVLTSIAAMEADDKCESLKLVVNKSDKLMLYGKSGIQREVIRQYDIIYQTQKWNESSKKFEDETQTYSNVDIGTEYVVDAPLVNTQFTLRGDQFGNHFNIPKEIKSSLYEAVAVQGKIIAEQSERDDLNESERPKGDALGGSAPISISFKAGGSQKVDYYTWTIYKSTDLNNAIARYTDQNFTYEFTEGGNFDYKVELEVAVQGLTCTNTESISFKISESWLDIPNYFSPGDSPGSNDEFRVAYKSLVEFKCTIFNRWGVKLYEWKDPSKGWDGKYKGKYVTTGVYFYVIEAKGSDGVRYKKAGDINILRSR